MSIEANGSRDQEVYRSYPVPDMVVLTPPSQVDDLLPKTSSHRQMSLPPSDVTVKPRNASPPRQFSRPPSEFPVALRQMATPPSQVTVTPRTPSLPGQFSRHLKKFFRKWFELTDITPGQLRALKESEQEPS
jgi:hypothetical protein